MLERDPLPWFITKLCWICVGEHDASWQTLRKKHRSLPHSAKVEPVSKSAFPSIQWIILANLPNLMQKNVCRIATWVHACLAKGMAAGNKCYTLSQEAAAYWAICSHLAVLPPGFALKMRTYPDIYIYIIILYILYKYYIIYIHYIIYVHYISNLKSGLFIILSIA
jgi:hypothetical protein